VIGISGTRTTRPIVSIARLIVVSSIRQITTTRKRHFKCITYSNSSISSIKCCPSSSCNYISPLCISWYMIVSTTWSFSCLICVCCISQTLFVWLLHQSVFQVTNILALNVESKVQVGLVGLVVEYEISALFHHL
jgi:hypothetical protein